jgi:hypothetical protein
MDGRDHRQGLCDDDDNDRVAVAVVVVVAVPEIGRPSPGRAR